jgi:tRNA(Ile)-lysidine synthase
MALALLSRAWGNPLALIVDHGLRPDSSDEAALTAARLKSLDIPSEILCLTSLGPGPGLAARARVARYQALTAATARAGRVDLLLGHHLRDQAETVLMRRVSHSGETGLAAMPQLAETRQIRLLRPLLGVPPGALRALLQAAGIAWVEDPSNHNQAALRTRLRDSLNDPDGNGDQVQSLAAEAFRHASRRALEDCRSAAELAARVTILPEGYAVLSPGQISQAALGALIRSLSGAPYAPSRASLARLAAEPRPAIVGGIRLMPAGKLGAGLLLVREPAAMSPPIPARAGAIWDRRFLLENDAGEGTSIGAVGADAPSLRRHTKLPAAILVTLPALRLNGVLVEVPHIRYRLPCSSARMAVGFAPSTPASGAPFVPDRSGDAETEVSPHLQG